MDPFSALQVAASIIQCIDVGVRVVERLNEFHNKAGDLPQAFKHIRKRLPVFIETLRHTHLTLENVSESARKALKPAADECLSQIQKLENVIESALPKLDDSSVTKSWKAVVSVKYESDIKDMEKVIKDYMEIFAQYQTSSLALQSFTRGKPVLDPISTCMYPRDVCFVDRAVMDDVMARCQPGRRLALTGLGGVGKSQIAIEFAHRIRDSSPQTWVFWVGGKDVASIKTSYRNIAKVLRLPGHDEQGTDIFTLVAQWLRSENNGPWVMVIDSADDPATLTESVTISPQTSADETLTNLPQIREFFTISRNGSMLITSTNTEAAQMLTGNCAYHIEVGEMTEDEAISLLKSKLHSKVVYAEDDAVKLVRAAECMPLTISQIAAHISMDYPRMTLQNAIEKLKNPEYDTSRLLEGSVHESNRDIRRTNSVVKSWHMSFQYVREKRPTAAMLLSLMCLFDRQGIPETLLTGQYGEEATAALVTAPLRASWWRRFRRRRLRRTKRTIDKTTLKPTGCELNFEDDWRVLHNLMLIKTNLDGHHFNMHRLVQHTTKRWLELKGELQFWTTRFVAIMQRHFPRPTLNPYNHEACCNLILHARHAANYRPTAQVNLFQWATLVRSLYETASVAGSHSVAELLGTLALATFEDAAGELNKEVLEVAHQLSWTNRVLKRLKIAEALARKAYEGRCRLLGPDHKDTIDSAHALAALLNLQEKRDEGEALHMLILDRENRVRGPGHVETIFKTRQISWSYTLDGRYNAAEVLQRRICEVEEKELGYGSEVVREDRLKLAKLFTLQGKYREAEEMYQENLKHQEEKAGLSGYGTIEAIHRLGEALIPQGKLAEIAVQYRRVKDIYGDLDCQGVKEQGLSCMESFIQVLSQQGELEEAEVLARWLIDERERFHGRNLDETMFAYRALAKVFTLQERFESALEMFEKAYNGMYKRSTENPDTAEFLNDLNAAKNRLLALEDSDANSVDSEKSSQSLDIQLLALKSPSLQPVKV